jgi:hypothetical protein
LLEIEDAGHDLGRDHVALADNIAAAFLELNGQEYQSYPQ